MRIVNERRRGLPLWAGRWVVVAAALASCGLVGPDDPLQSLEFVGAEAEIVEGTLHVVMSVRNPSDRPVTLRWGGCPILAGAAVRVWTGAPPDGQLRWDERSQAFDACWGLVNSVEIAPGGEGPVQGGTSVFLILGDSLAPGTYHLTVVPDFHESIPDIELHLGEFELRD